MDNESGFNSQIRNGQMVHLKSIRHLTKALVIYIHTMFLPWRIRQQNEKEPGSGVTHFYYFSPLYYYACNKYMFISAKYMPGTVLGSWGTSRNRRDKNFCPRGADLMFPLFSKGLQFYRCLSMTRICCLSNRGWSLLLGIVRSVVSWKGAENQGLFSNEGHFSKPATPKTWINYQSFCEGSTVWELGQKKIVPEGRKRPEVPEFPGELGGWGEPHWPWDDRRMLRARERN